MPQLWIHHRWSTATRYYEIYLHQDLWGGWVLTQAWGGKGSRLGRVKHRPCADYDQGQAWLERIGRRRVRRGYQPADSGFFLPPNPPNPDTARPGLSGY